jgi:sulfur-carrier protein adenylyltransferase/sulfurtransferase
MICSRATGRSAARRPSSRSSAEGRDRRPYIAVMLSADELTRYARQLILPELGVAGQEKLGRARVLVVGAGGLGSPVALYLAAAGIGELGIIDDDRVELSNLHRQILHTTSELGRAKAESASRTLERLNPEVTVRSYPERLDAHRAKSLFPGYDLVVDGSDNYKTRYAVNDACATLGLPWVYGSVERFSGQVSLFGAPGGPCYRCLFPEPPAPDSTASCEEIGVLGAVPGVVGALQASEALKWILGIGTPLAGRLLTLDLLTMAMQSVAFERRPDCTACGDSTGAARSESRPEHDDLPDIEPRDLARQLDAREPIELVDVREPWEWEIGKIGTPRLLAMNDLPRALETLDADREMVIYCHHGVRSGMAAEWLRSQGYKARNLAGGIDRWSREVDPAVRRY